MEYECDICNKKFSNPNSLEQHKSMAHKDNSEGKNKTNFKKYFIIMGLILIAGLLSATIYLKSSKSGKADSFAQCLTEKNVIVYGNDYCTYTNQNLNFFGKSKKYLNYIKCVENEELCNEKNVEITPTWEINGEVYSGVQNFKKLSELSGCEL